MNGTPLVKPLVQGDWLKYEEDHNYSRENIVVDGGDLADGLRHGTVLAKYTSGGDVGKYTPFDPDGTTGEQTVVGILAEDIRATSSDTAAAAIVRHAHIAPSALNWAVAATDPEKAAALAVLAAAGILAVREV